MAKGNRDSAAKRRLIAYFSCKSFLPLLYHLSHGGLELSFRSEDKLRNQVVEYPSGLDVEWIAMDRKGRVGVFTTAGNGPIPKACLTDAEVLDQIRDAIRSLPEVMDYELVATVPRPDDFISFAKRGLFSFDWDEFQETPRYEVQARPKTPLTVDAIAWPQELRGLLPQVTSSVLDFDVAIDVTSALECAVEPPENHDHNLH